MKKIAVLVILCLFAINMVEAQKREQNRAKRQLNRGNLTEAWEHINNALNDESTKNDPATWVIKSKILIEMNQAEDPEQQNLEEEPLEKAVEAIEKAQELDETNINLLDIQQTLIVLAEALFNEGAEAYNENEFSSASNYFLNAYNVSDMYGTVDTSTLYNAGLSAELAQNFDEAYEIYTDVAALDYDQPFLYSSLANISLRNKDFEEAEKWIKKGRDLYPDELDLIFVEANVYLTSGNIPEARRVLELAIDRDPENANLHYAFAVNYDQMSKDTMFTEEEREFAFNEAINSYKTAIELKPDYFDAIYNLGALYFNQGIQLFVKADDILRQGYSNENLKKANELEERSKRIWREDAQPYLEKAFDLIDEDDENYEVVLRSLRELYMRTGQSEKLEVTDEIWKEKYGSEEEQE